MIITFYSYKGGVGRSMALVNVAEILADVGYDVILCDFDLEAPGLERYVTDDLDLMQRLRASQGVIDLLEEYRQALAGPVQPEGAEPTSAPEGFRDINGLHVRRPSSCAVPISSPNAGRLGGIRFLSAGRRDGSWSSQYSERVQQFDWSDFYQRWAGAAYVDFFREDLTEGQTIVMVDSRTGVTEHAGICTHHLADLVVLLSAPNDINIEGTRWMASTITAADLDALRRGRPLQVMPVASRVETVSEAGQLAAFRQRFEREFATFVPAAAGDAREFIQATEIPYIPYFAFTEKVVARQNVLLHRELYGAYDALAHAVVKVGLDARMLTMPRRQDWLGPLELGTAEGRITAGLARERWLADKPKVRQAKFVNPPPMAVPRWFQGRFAETQLIGEFLRDSGLRLLTVVGRGGVGKTAMVCRVLKALEAGRLPDDGGELPVDAIVYLSPVGIHPVSFPNLLADLTRVLPDAQAQRLQQLYRDPQQTPSQLMLTLLEAFPDGCTIVLLDNLEDLIDPATLKLSDAALDAALGELLAAPQHGIKIIATTRLVPRDLLLRNPSRQRRLDLDEGLSVPEAINLLRAMDEDGALGLRDASPELLAAACKRTRGFPRALEALAAILAADRDTRLSDLFTAPQDELPGNIVEVLVGEAFDRLDPLGQQVMQALAIYAAPVPPVAVDYLLQPFQPAIDSSPVLSRLVNMYFARRDAGRYYVHQVDREYALARIPPGQREDADARREQFTRYELRARAAGYFEQTRTPRDSWQSLDDMAPQLAEFELRCANADYDAAATVLATIDNYLQRWAHYRLAAELHERLTGRLTDPHWQMATAGALGDSYWGLGQTERAVEHYQQALAITREIGDRRSEGYWLGCLGSSYSTLGQTERAVEHLQQALAIAREIGDRHDEGLCLGSLGGIHGDLGETDKEVELYRQALAIAREIGDRRSEGYWLGRLGSSYSTVGQADGAIEHYQQALAIAREIGDRRSEGQWLGNLSGVQTDLGHTEQAVEYGQQALAIAREIGDLRSEGLWLGNLGGIYADLGQTERAVEHYDRAAEIGDDTGDVQVQAEARLGLAQVHLYREEWPEATQAAEAAHLRNYPGLMPQVFSVLGSAYLCEGDRAKADDAFSASLSAADNLLASTHGMIHVLYAKGIACAGRAVTGKPDGAAAARSAFDQALAIAPAPGVRARTLQQLDVLIAVDADGTLTDLRLALAGST